MIAQIDDVMQLKKSTIQHSRKFPFVLVCQMCLYKNIHEEQESPKQIIFGSMETIVCPLLHLAIYLERIVLLGDISFKSRQKGTASLLIKCVFESNFFRQRQTIAQVLLAPTASAKVLQHMHQIGAFQGS